MRVLRLLLLSASLVSLGAAAGGKRWDEDVDEELLAECPECVIEQHLLPRLSKLYPPRGANGSALHVDCRIVVKELMEMSVKSETFQVMAWIRLIWYDHSATWDPKRFKINEVRLVPRQLWVPDMMISNSLSNFEIYEGGTNLPVIAGYDGFRFWSVPAIINTKCTADVTYFPFDMQFCRVKMNSWTYHEKIIKLSVSGFSTGLEGHVGNIEWTLARVKGYILYEPAITNHPLYKNESIVYSYIEYRVALIRKPDFYVNTLVVPSLLLSWLGAVIFLLPSECGEKLSFSITLFLALYINQVIVSEFLPPSADTYPLIAKFYMLISMFLGGSIFLTAVILMFHFRLNHSVPREGTLMYALFRLAEKIGSLNMTCTSEDNLTPMSKKRSRRSLKKQSNQLECTDVNGGISNYMEKSRRSEDEEEFGGEELTLERQEHQFQSRESSAAAAPDAAQVVSFSRRIEHYLSTIISKLDVVVKEDESDITMRRWRLIASALDRVFFISYVAIMGATSFYFYRLAATIGEMRHNATLIDETLDHM